MLCVRDVALLIQLWQDLTSVLSLAFSITLLLSITEGKNSQNRPQSCNNTDRLLLDIVSMRYSS